MTYTDNELTLSTAQAITSGATIASEESIDLTTSPDMGNGRGFAAQISATTVPAGNSVATVTFDLVTSAATGLGTPRVIGSSGPIPVADLTATSPPIVVRPNPANQALPVDGVTERYLGIVYTPDASPTSGNFSATLVLDPAPRVSYYPAGSVIA